MNTNMDVARLLGITAIEGPDGTAVAPLAIPELVNIDILAETTQGAWYREQVVKVLLEVHGIWIDHVQYINEDPAYVICGEVYMVNMYHQHWTYPEAVAAAVNFVMKEQ